MIKNTGHVINYTGHVIKNTGHTMLCGYDYDKDAARPKSGVHELGLCYTEVRARHVAYTLDDVT